MQVISVTISGTCFLINNALGTQEKRNRLLSQAKQICIKTIQKLQPCSGDFAALYFQAANSSQLKKFYTLIVC